MAIERTLTIVKPDGVAAQLTGAVLARLEKAGLKIIALRRLHLTRAQAEAFYAVHRQRPFFADLVRFMT
ncbi:MAG: nucleoside-diphosphate kinase, partial [Terriglobales bacterium]